MQSPQSLSGTPPERRRRRIVGAHISLQANASHPSPGNEHRHGARAFEHAPRRRAAAAAHAQSGGRSEQQPLPPPLLLPRRFWAPRALLTAALPHSPLAIDRTRKLPPSHAVQRQGTPGNNGRARSPSGRAALGDHAVRRVARRRHQQCSKRSPMPTALRRGAYVPSAGTFRRRTSPASPCRRAPGLRATAPPPPTRSPRRCSAGQIAAALACAACRRSGARGVPRGTRGRTHSRSGARRGAVSRRLRQQRAATRGDYHHQFIRSRRRRRGARNPVADRCRAARRQRCCHPVAAGPPHAPHCR
jgi:hypothetical protein